MSTILSNLQVAFNLPTQIFGEVLAPGATPGTWTSIHAPALGTACVYANGVRQKEGLDYTVAGNVFTSPFWSQQGVVTVAGAVSQGASLLCDYQVEAAG